MVALTMLQIALLGALAIFDPRISFGSVACVAILIAGGFVVFRELRVSNLPASQPPPRAPSPAPPPPASAPWSPDRTERRSDGIQIHANDSVNQIARAMVMSSFRQASMKYHPDHGGRNDLMARIVEARALLLRAID